MTPELKIALEEVQKHFPEVSLVVFNLQGQWQYMSQDFESVDFADKIDFDILDDASNSVYSKYGFPYVYQEPEEEQEPIDKVEAQLVSGEEFLQLLKDNPILFAETVCKQFGIWCSTIPELVEQNKDVTIYDDKSFRYIIFDDAEIEHYYYFADTKLEPDGEFEFKGCKVPYVLYLNECD